MIRLNWLPRRASVPLISALLLGVSTLACGPELTEPGSLDGDGSGSVDAGGGEEGGGEEGDGEEGGGEEGGGDEGGSPEPCEFPVVDGCVVSLDGLGAGTIEAVAVNDSEIFIGYEARYDMFGNSLDDGGVIAIERSTGASRVLFVGVTDLSFLRASDDYLYIVGETDDAPGPRALLQMPLSGEEPKVISASTNLWSAVAIQAGYGQVAWIEADTVHLAEEQMVESPVTFGSKVNAFALMEDAVAYRRDGGSWFEYDVLEQSVSDMPFTENEKIIYDEGVFWSHRRALDKRRISRASRTDTEWINIANCDTSNIAQSLVHADGHITLDVWGGQHARIRTFDINGSETGCVEMAQSEESGGVLWDATETGIFLGSGAELRFVPYP